MWCALQGAVNIIDCGAVTLSNMVAKMPAIFYFTQNYKLSKSMELNICIARNEEYDISNNNNNNNNNNKFLVCQETLACMLIGDTKSLK